MNPHSNTLDSCRIRYCAVEKQTDVYESGKGRVSCLSACCGKLAMLPYAEPSGSADGRILHEPDPSVAAQHKVESCTDMMSIPIDSYQAWQLKKTSIGHAG